MQAGSLAALIHLVEAEGFAFPAGRVVMGTFGDSAPLSERLLSRIRAGDKRATASLLWTHEAEGDPIPARGDLEIAVDSAGRPAAVLRYTAVEVVPFEAVATEFARAEGAGSLASWRQAHWDFFARECARFGREPAPDMPVVCANFEVLHHCRSHPDS